MIAKLWDLLDYSLKSLNLPIVWGYQNAPRIQKPYVMVTYTSGRMPDHEIYGDINLLGIRINSSWRRAIVMLQFYCETDSFSKASKSVSLLATEDSLNKQVELDVSIGHRLMLEHVPALLNLSQYEDRAIYQFEFYYTEWIDDNAGRIETIIIDGTYDGPDDGGAGGNVTPLHCHHVVSTNPSYVAPLPQE